MNCGEPTQSSTTKVRLNLVLSLETVTVPDRPGRIDSCPLGSMDSMGPRTLTHQRVLRSSYPFGHGGHALLPDLGSPRNEFNVTARQDSTLLDPSADPRRLQPRPARPCSPTTLAKLAGPPWPRQIAWRGPTSRPPPPRSHHHARPRAHRHPAPAHPGP